MKLEHYQRLLRTVEEAKSKHERAQGAAKQLLIQLQNEFGCSTLEEARALKTKLEARIQKQEEKLNQQMEAFLSKWKDFLDENS